MSVVVEAADPAHEVHPGGHVLLRVGGQVVNSPRGADIEHILEADLAALEGQAGVNLRQVVMRTHYRHTRSHNLVWILRFSQQRRPLQGPFPS